MTCVCVCVYVTCVCVCTRHGRCGNNNAVVVFGNDGCLNLNEKNSSAGADGDVKQKRFLYLAEFINTSSVPPLRLLGTSFYNVQCRI